VQLTFRPNWEHTLCSIYIFSFRTASAKWHPHRIWNSRLGGGVHGRRFEAKDIAREQVALPMEWSRAKAKTRFSWL